MCIRDRERSMQKSRQFGEATISGTWIVNMHRPQNGKHFARSASRFHQISLLPVLLGQPGGKGSLDQKRMDTKETLTPGDRNIVREPLVQRENIILPPLHIKLGLMKQFVKTPVSYTHLTLPTS